MTYLRNVFCVFISFISIAESGVRPISPLLQNGHREPQDAASGRYVLPSYPLPPLIKPKFLSKDKMFYDFLTEQTSNPEHSPRLPIIGHFELDAIVIDNESIITKDNNDSLQEEGPCGVTPNDRIIGGNFTKPHSFPWTVGLTSNWGLHFCGGSLINSKYVLTAAHCVAWGSEILNAKIHIGDHDIASLSDPHLMTRSVKKIKYHSLYDSSTTNYDVALIELDTPVKYGDNIRPICLPEVGFNDKSYVGTSATVTGWGHTSFGGRGSRFLKEVNVEIISNKECSSMYGPGKITTKMLCAGSQFGGKDSCQGDSGGPLFSDVEDKSRYVQVGIVSWGKGCGLAEYPGVYARVSTLRKWIKHHSK